MKNPVTRRHFLATAGAAASVTLLSQPLFDGSAARAAVPLVRRDVGKMDANDPHSCGLRQRHSEDAKPAEQQPP